jgi:hypothetical protein
LFLLLLLLRARSSACLKSWHEGIADRCFLPPSSTPLSSARASSHIPLPTTPHYTLLLPNGEALPARMAVYSSSTPFSSTKRIPTSYFHSNSISTNRTILLLPAHSPDEGKLYHLHPHQYNHIITLLRIPRGHDAPPIFYIILGTIS